MFIEGGTDEKRCGGEEKGGGGEAAQGAAHQGPEGAEQAGHQLLEEEQDRGGGQRSSVLLPISRSGLLFYIEEAQPRFKILAVFILHCMRILGFLDNLWC
jgi:hypothetical protein